MSRAAPRDRAWRAAAAVALVTLAAPAGSSARAPNAAPQPSAAAPAPTAAGADLVERGRYLTVAGDCAGCHTAPDGTPFAGGTPLRTPFGTVLSANITSATMATWSPDLFYRALHRGGGGKGGHLYPAFPYVYYARVTRADSDAMLAYLKTTPPVHNKLDRNQLPFPFNNRGLMVFWNALFLREGEFRPDPARSAEWNRGAYLVEGLGHCGACHTPKNPLGADRQTARYQGGVLDNWLAPDLTANPRWGLGGWSTEQVVEFLKTGRNARSAASGAMADVVTHSTSQMTEADLRAIAVYLKSLPASHGPSPPASKAAAMRSGQAIFVDACSACHRMDGSGQPGFFSPLPANATVQQRDPATVVRIVLNGARAAPTDTRPTPLSMPAFGWKLDDREVAAVTTYVRNSWGNAAPPVSAAQVAKIRKRTQPEPATTQAQR
ncbi:c-type cytochrome [Phenylobacterium sp. LjRoot219]|uniref:c-type cytochrome n=1 Tax=Phenylobacterium sp. LjRoot219 TaxID=3342283 RepID=UPI003ECEEEF6